VTAEGRFERPAAPALRPPTSFWKIIAKLEKRKKTARCEGTVNLGTMETQIQILGGKNVREKY
jgi:hypothetical protein